VLEASGSIFEDPEPRFDMKLMSPGSMLAFAVREFEQSIVPGAAVSALSRRPGHCSRPFNKNNNASRPN